MHRINSVNARQNQNGIDKAGFHDNADLAGQDATYLTPIWCNTVQEEIANVIEGFGDTLDLQNNAQLLGTLNKIVGKITELKNQVDGLESDLANYQDTAIGDLYITTKHFENADAVAIHKGYGTWSKFGNGHALMTQSNDETDPNWMQNLKSTGGENSTRIASAHLPAHNHIDEGSAYNKLVAAMKDITAVDGDGGGEIRPVADATNVGDNRSYIQVSDISVSQFEEMQIKTVGENQAFSLMQKSIVIAAWLRES